MIDLHAENKYDLAQLIHLEQMLELCLDLLNLLASLRGDSHAVDVEAYICHCCF